MLKYLRSQPEKFNMSTSENHFNLPNRLYPWLILSLAFLFLFYRFLLQIYPTHAHCWLPLNLFQTNDSLSLDFFISYIMAQGLFAGYLIDRFGVKVQSSLAIALCALGTLLFAISNNFILEVLSRIIMGIGVAFATVTYLKVAVTWFDSKRFAILAGLLSTAAVIGSVFEKSSIPELLSFGWEQSLIIIAISGFVLASLFALLVPDLPISKTPVQLNDIKKLIKTPQNYVFIIYGGLVLAPVVVFCNFWGSSFINVYHYNTQQKHYLIECLLLGLALGSPIIGFFADYFFKRWKLWMLITLLTQAIIFIALVYILSLSFSARLILMFCFGFFSGGYVLSLICAKYINPMNISGMVMAWINTGIAVIGGASYFLITRGLAISGPRYHYQLEFLILPGFLLLVFILLLRIPEITSESIEI